MSSSFGFTESIIDCGLVFGSTFYKSTMTCDPIYGNCSKLSISYIIFPWSNKANFPTVCSLNTAVRMGFIKASLVIFCTLLFYRKLLVAENMGNTKACNKLIAGKLKQLQSFLTRFNFSWLNNAIERILNFPRLDDLLSFPFRLNETLMQAV